MPTEQGGMDSWYDSGCKMPMFFLLPHISLSIFTKENILLSKQWKRHAWNCLQRIPKILWVLRWRTFAWQCLSTHMLQKVRRDPQKPELVAGLGCLRFVDLMKLDSLWPGYCGASDKYAQGDSINCTLCGLKASRKMMLERSKLLCMFGKRNPGILGILEIDLEGCSEPFANKLWCWRH